MLNIQGEEGKDGRPAELKGRSVPDGGKAKGVSPAKVAEALRSLAQRAANAEKEIAEIKNERGYGKYHNMMMPIIYHFNTATSRDSLSQHFPV